MLLDEITFINRRLLIVYYLCLPIHNHFTITYTKGTDIVKRNVLIVM